MLARPGMPCLRMHRAVSLILTRMLARSGMPCLHMHRAVSLILTRMLARPGMPPHAGLRGMEDSFVVLGSASMLRQPGSLAQGAGRHLQLPALQPHLKQQQHAASAQGRPARPSQPGLAAAAPPGAAGMPDARQLLPGERLPAMAAPGAAAGTSLPSTGPSEHEQGASLQPPQLQLLPEQLPLPPPPQQQALSARQPALTQQQQAQAVQQADALATGLDAKLCALASIFELASMATQIDHPLCLDCEAQLKDEMEAQVWAEEGVGTGCGHRGGVDAGVGRVQGYGASVGMWHRCGAVAADAHAPSVHVGRAARISSRVAQMW
eukprot:364766-Chlamydomonas_euryale.AAC.6